MTEAIRTEHLKFSYDAQSESGGVMVFDDLNLSIEEGSFIAVLGHNGCGKSTLAKHFNAVLLPEGGSVHVFGMDTSDESLLVDIRRTVGMVFQNPDNQMVANVVEEDVAFAPENLGVPSEEIRRRVDEALKLVGMYDYRLHAPHLLSGGQKRRVAIAGVIAMEPEVVIFDEPTAGLDPAGCASILGNIRDYQKATHATILMVTHSMDEVAQLADRMLVLNEGTIEMSGTPREVFSHAARLAEIGLSVPQVTALFLRLRELGVDVDPTTFTVEQAVPQLRALLEGRAHA